MSLVDQLIARLRTGVPELGNRVEGAAALGALARSGGVPQAALVAHVVPAGLVGGQDIPLTGIYRQDTTRLTTVLLTANTGHAQGGHVADRLEELIDKIILAVVGWQPPDNFGSLILRRAQLLRAEGGIFSYEITFAVAQEVRIIP